jgi:hypothetical protein
VDVERSCRPLLEVSGTGLSSISKSASDASCASSAEDSDSSESRAPGSDRWFVDVAGEGSSTLGMATSERSDSLSYGASSFVSVEFCNGEVCPLA